MPRVILAKTRSIHVLVLVLVLVLLFTITFQSSFSFFLLSTTSMRKIEVVAREMLIIHHVDNSTAPSPHSSLGVFKDSPRYEPLRRLLAPMTLLLQSSRPQQLILLKILAPTILGSENSGFAMERAR